MDKALAGNLFFKNYDFDLQLLRSLGHIYDNGADFGECMSTAFNIIEGDFDSWYEAWNNTAARIETLAEQSMDRGHVVSARRAYMRATEYYRAAEYFLREDLDDPRSQECSRKIRECFQRAVASIYPKVDVLKIDYQDSYFPGYFFRAHEDDKKAPTVIIIGGYDSFVEESYFLGGRAALIRGYNVLMFDGPGQGHVLRDQGMHFHSDWDHVIAPVIDQLLSFECVDPDKIVLMGRNFAGYLAIKSASAVPQHLSALVLDPGQYDIGLTLRKQLPAEIMTLFDCGEMGAFDQKIEDMFEADQHLRFFFKSRMAAHNVNHPSEYFIELANYKIQPAELAKITCPTAVCVSSDDFIATEQSKYVFDHLNCDKQMFEFSFDEGAGDRNEFGAPALFYLRVFDWLDDIFGIKHEALPVPE